MCSSEFVARQLHRCVRLPKSQFGPGHLSEALCKPVWKSKFYGVIALNLRVDLHAIDATPARRRGGAGSSPLDRISTAASVLPTHWLISTQTLTHHFRLLVTGMFDVDTSDQPPIIHVVEAERFHVVGVKC